MIYYTNQILEDLINKPYLEALKNKEIEIEEKERKTGKLQKYAASFYISKPSRVFICKNNKVYLKIGGRKLLTPTEPIENGKIYMIDLDFIKKFNSFISINPNYSIEFTFSHGSVDYCAGPNIYSSTIYSLDNPEVFEIYEDEDKFDLVCG